MWIKVLGLVCAGVFIGATLVELKQFRIRKKQRADTSDQPDDQPAGQPVDQPAGQPVEPESDAAAAENI